MQKKSLNFLETLNSGDTYRGDCPECGGDNSFSAINEYGSVKYHCFRSSCPLSGSINKEMSYEDVCNALNDDLRGEHDNVRRVYSIPDHFVSVAERSEVIEYLRKNNCLTAYYERRADVRYDPKQNRVVFLIKEDGVCYGAIGRAQDRSVTPKWFNYAIGEFLYICRNSSSGTGRKTGCIVEDCASACAVSSLYDGISLLGTNLGAAYLRQLVDFDKLYIALDKDASDKAFEMHRYLSFYCKDVRIVLLEKDLKYLKKEEIGHVIGRFS